MPEHLPYCRDAFDTLFRRCLDNIATDAETDRFQELLDESAERRAEYMEMMALVAAARISGKALRGNYAPPAPPAASRVRWAIAAAFALIMSGSVVFFSGKQRLQTVVPEMTPVAAGEQKPRDRLPSAAWPEAIVRSAATENPQVKRKTSSAAMVAVESKQEQNMSAKRMLKTAAVAVVAAAVISPPRVTRAAETGVSTAVTVAIALDTRVNDTAPTAGQALETRVNTTAVTKKTNLNTTKFKGLVVMLI